MAETTLEMFQGQLSYQDIRDIPFPEISGLKSARERRLHQQQIDDDARMKVQIKKQNRNK